MVNDPELNGKYLGNITKDFVVVADTLKEAAYAIRKRGFSEYPVFPMSRVDQVTGQLLIHRRDLKLEWNFYASYLDEFVQRGLVEDQEAFKAAYKDPDEYCCLFVIDYDFTNFVFLPYPED
jgi:hypothetical protein